MAIRIHFYSNRCRFWTVVVTALATGCCLLGRTTEAAEESRAILKSYFETGDIPTEEQFSNLIDSFIHRLDDGLTYNGATPDAATQGALLGEGTEVGPGSFFTPVAGLGEEWIGQSGFLALSLELNSQTHYGYVQITSPPGDLYPMLAEFVVYETVPNTPISVAHIPEPTALALLTLGTLMFMGLKRRNRDAA